MAEQVLLFCPYSEKLKGKIRVSDVKLPTIAVRDAIAKYAHNHHSNLHLDFHRKRPGQRDAVN